MSNSERPGEKNQMNWKQKRGLGNPKNKKETIIMPPEIRQSVAGGTSSNDQYYTEYIPREFDLGRTESMDCKSLSQSVVDTATKEN